MEKPKKYDWTQFTLRVFIKASPEKVFKAWTDDKIVNRWFTEKTVIEPKKNGRIYFEWIGGDKLETRVVSIVKNRLFQFPFGSHDEQVAIKISKDKNGTTCELHQFNLRTSPKDKVSMHMGCKEGWTFFLTNLKAYLENGIDLRGHDPQKCYRQSYVNS